MFQLGLVEDDDTELSKSGGDISDPADPYQCIDGGTVHVQLEGPHHTVGQSDTGTVHILCQPKKGGSRPPLPPLSAKSQKLAYPPLPPLSEIIF